jgi:hypothetical protein
LVKIEGTLDEIAELFESGRRTVKSARRLKRAATPVAKKVKRKASAYSKEVGRQLKKLKKKHPRTPVSKLMKRAHAAAKRARK